MTSLQPFTLPPRWLPLRLLLGGIIVAVVLLLAKHHPMSVLYSRTATVPGLWGRCGSSLLVLVLALSLALCLGLFVGIFARQLGPRMELLVALLGRALACVPVVVVVWGFISHWIGRLGWPVESLMLTQFSGTQDSRQVLLARTLWEFLAPALILALPLCGELIHCVIWDGRATLDLDFSLRARGVPKGSRLWRHHLSQLLPLLRVRLQSLCLFAPVYLIIIEDALHFMGWGDWLAQSLRAGNTPALALGWVSGGVMLAFLCACLQLLPGRLKSVGGFVAMLAWQPWLFWALGVLALVPASSLSWLVIWVAVLVSGSACWHQSWNQIEAELPVDAARVFGASELLIWRNHFAVVQCRLLVAWICSAFAQTLLWIAAACALLPRLVEELDVPLAKIYRPLAIATVQDAAQTLADPTALLQSGGIIALAALCLIQVSRIVQPRLS